MAHALYAVNVRRSTGFINAGFINAGFINAGGMFVLWIVGGLAYPAIALVTPYIGGVALTSVKTIVGALMAFAFAAMTKRRKLTSHEVVWNIFLGILLYSVSMTLLAFASVHLPASLLAVGFACMPLILMVWNWIDGDRPSLWMVVGFLVAFGGLVSIVAAPGMTKVSANPILGWGLLAASVFTWTYGLRLWVRKIKRAEPIRSAAVQLAAGGITMLPLVFFLGVSFEALPVEVMWWFVFLILAQAVTHIAYVGLSSRISSTLLSTFTLINPAVAAIAGWFMLDQSLTWRMNIGVVLALIGTALVTRAEISHRMNSFNSVSSTRVASTGKKRLQESRPRQSTH